MADTKRGGARAGAGRPKGEDTIMVRVPEGCLEAVRALISAYRNNEPLPSPAAPVAEPVVPTDAQKAWDVYSSMFARRVAGDHLQERFFALASDTEYPFIFLLHLLENLLNLPVNDKDIPIQWTNIRELRQFAKQLYIRNGHLK
ncbi:hypothetical protein [Aeromonas enteropelogenes]|uniref:hypothetical protein n=1 Tax=Aeromonas enteropelogenes TaxID=29489 RepID=UPI000F5474A5|nr:hypothetical protein [Aeromonas enteropelogenes]RQM71374.1 hypothetical protein EHZ64_00150 [Aeromonas enteropelogenes]